MPNVIMFGLMGMAFTFVLATGQTLYWWYIARQEKAQEELLRRIAGGGDDANPLDRLIRESEGDSTVKALGGFGAKLQGMLTASDSTMTVTNVITAMAVLSAVGALIGFIMLGTLGLLAGTVLGIIPYFALSFMAGRRAAALVAQLPEALDLMTRALQAGVGLSDAFRLAAEELKPPLSLEFSRVFEEVRFGRDYRDAFQTLMKRNPTVFDLRLMVSSILLQRETGGNLIEILESIATTIRARFQFQEKVNAMTSEAKMTALILSALPFLVLMALVVISPTYIMPLFERFEGHVILVFALGTYALGGYIMYNLTQVEV